MSQVVVLSGKSNLTRFLRKGSVIWPGSGKRDVYDVMNFGMAGATEKSRDERLHIIFCSYSSFINFFQLHLSFALVCSWLSFIQPILLIILYLAKKTEDTKQM